MKNIASKFLNAQSAATGLFLVVAVSLMLNTVKVVQRNYELQQDVDVLADEVALVEVQNQNLKYNIEYYKTDSFLEVEAKRRFNLAEKGEKVILLPKDGDADPDELNDTFQEPTDPRPQYQENFEKWMIFLFGSAN